MNADASVTAVVYKTSEKKLETVFISEEKSGFDFSSLCAADYDDIFPVPLDKTSWKLQLSRKETTNNNDIVDIWYGYDPALQKKFEPNLKNSFFILNTESKILVPVNDTLFEEAVILNKNYAVGFNYYDLQDYSKRDIPIKIHWLKNNFNKISEISSPVILSGPSFTNENGTLMIDETDYGWCVYKTSSGEKDILSITGLDNPYFDKSNILFDGKELSTYDFHGKKYKSLFSLPEHTIKIVNTERKRIGNKFEISTSLITNPQKIVSEVRDKNGVLKDLMYYKDGKVNKIWSASDSTASSLTQDKAFRKFFWIAQSYASSPVVMFARDGHEPEVLYSKNKKVNLRREIILYDLDGEKLEGTLFYPEQFDESKKYPVVVSIYEKQNKKRNDFVIPTLKNQSGFNLRNLVSEVYFVYLPDISFNVEGPGKSALKSVEEAVKALTTKKYINAAKIALAGTSFGGYETNFIATHSKIFATYISGVALSDIVNDYHAFSDRYYRPNFWWYESWQMRMKVPFHENKMKYFENNPLYYADQVSAPILLWTGILDENINWRMTRTFYNALKRNNKKVIALFYKKNSHGLMDFASQKDLSLRFLDWCDYFLKDKKIDWIHKEMKDTK